MSILSEQLIGNDNTENPFASPSEDQETYTGFGGYTYAATPEMQEVFNTTALDQRTGPVEDEPLGQGSGTQYGPLGRRLPNTATTLLGEMAGMLSKHGRRDEWSTAGGGAKIARLFESSSSLKSLRDSSGVTRGRIPSSAADSDHPSFVPNASGGPFVGYDSSHEYGVNWSTVEFRRRVGSTNWGEETFKPAVTVQTGLHGSLLQPQ